MKNKGILPIKRRKLLPSDEGILAYANGTCYKVEAIFEINNTYYAECTTLNSFNKIINYRIKLDELRLDRTLWYDE